MACALPWHLGKGLSHLTSCTFRCRSVFHFCNRKYSHIFTSFFSWPVFKTKRIFWKMANKFFRTSIPSSVPTWHRILRWVTCPMPYSLLASHCTQCRDCLRWPRQAWLPGSVGSRRSWDWWWGARWPVRACSGPFSHSSFRRDCILLWNLVPPEDRAPSARLRDGWPAWPRTSHCWQMACSCLTWWRALLAIARVWPPYQPMLPPCCGPGWLFHPTVHWERSAWVLCLGKDFGLLVLGRLWG